MKNSSKSLNSKAFELKPSDNCEDDSAINKPVTMKNIGAVSFFAFDTNQGLRKNMLPFDSELYVLNGEAEISIHGQQQHVGSGEMLNIPAHIPHSLQAKEPFVMMLVKVCDE